MRFRPTPEIEACWQLLGEAGVDHINTDKLSDLEQFPRRSSPRP